MVAITVTHGDIAQYAAKAIVVNLFEGVHVPGGGTGAVDRALGGGISQLIAEGDIKGKSGEITVIHTFGKIAAGRALVLGLGDGDKFTLDKVRTLTANVVRHLRRLGVEEAATITHGAGIAGLDPEACAQAMAEGAVLGLYTFTHHKKPETDPKELKSLILVEHDPAKIEALRRGVERGVILAEAANQARDMANEPSNFMTPTELAARARAIADQSGLECQILDREEMIELGMGGLLGVAQGSHQPPKFIVLHYKGDPSTDRAIGLVGKGITFDTGGISIKPAQGMEAMKGDMTGAAAVIAATGALGRLKPRINVTAVAPCTENMPGGGAIKPGDVLRAMNGKTIEVVNTDAEGRLVLSDGLSYARRLDLSPIIDVATLTGAISVALGNVAMGVMSNDDALVNQIKSAGAASGEKVWQLPMYEEYKEQIKSEVADMKNSGGRPAGSITAAWMLAEFVDNTPWAHLDIAGVDDSDREKGEIVKGSTGIPVRTLINFVLTQAGTGAATAK